LQLNAVRGVFHRGGGLTRAAGRPVLVLVGTLAAGVALGDPKPSTMGLQVESIVVEARPIAAFDKANPKETRFGKLTWRGGLVLTSPSPNFGGWSGLALAPDGRSFLAVSDAGTWMTGALVYDRGRPKAVQSVRLGPLQSQPGKTIARSRDRDAEGLALVKGTPAKGRVLISFERDHRIARFDIGDEGLSAAKGHIALPAAARRMGSNRGLEAITLLRGGPYAGSLVAIAERLPDRSGNHTGWLWIKGRPRAFQLSNRDGFDITDAAALSDGSLLVLERRFRWSEGVKMRLRLVRRDELIAGASIEGETLLDASLNHEIDNMEGLAVHTGAGGEIVVTMISDDNFNHALQRTLLLQFALEGADLANAAARP
jgi:hypothetical protein